MWAVRSVNGCTVAKSGVQKIFIICILLFASLVSRKYSLFASNMQTTLFSYSHHGSAQENPRTQSCGK